MTNVRKSASQRKEFEAIKLRFEELKSARLPIEPLMRELGDYVATTDDVDPISRGDNQLPRNRIDSTAQIAIERLRALLNGYLFNPFTPFFVARLADREPRYAERLWLEQVNRKMHKYLTGPRSPFRVQMGISLYSSAVYGWAPMWIGRKKNRLITTALNVWDAWIDEDPETGLTDTLYRRFRLPAWRAAQRYGDMSPGLKDLAAKDPYAIQTFILGIEPQEGGEVGGFKTEKPFIERTVWEGGEEVVERDGYDGAPMSALRFYRRPNTPYALGPGATVLPYQKLIVAREDNAVQAEEQNINPTLMDFSNGAVDVLDRRPGAEVPVDASQINLWNRNGRPYERLYDPVNLTDSHARVERLRALVQEGCFVDWMSMGDGKYATAEFVADRRDLRMRGMASIVAGMEYDFNQIGERMFNVMQSMRLFPEAPVSLAGEEIEFDLVSPLKQAQQQGEVEKLLSWLEVVAQGVALDPMTGRVANVPSVARDAARQLGIPEEHIRSAEEVDAERVRLESAEAAEQEAMFAQAAASALRDGGQGAAALIGAGSAGAPQ